MLRHSYCMASREIISRRTEVAHRDEGRSHVMSAEPVLSPDRAPHATTSRSSRDRHPALGVWAAVSGLGGAAGVVFGGLLTEGPGWRWVLFVNVPFSLIALAGAFALLTKERTRARLANFDALGA